MDSESANSKEAPFNCYISSKAVGYTSSTQPLFYQEDVGRKIQVPISINQTTTNSLFVFVTIKIILFLKSTVCPLQHVLLHLLWYATIHTILLRIVQNLDI